ncbi:hypothetical protein APA_1017 [Pseudanabaena sp. lw0831]|uniref:hypothetical protein n=1 Tax=Pseudanabaena sp. lw0831 TaxID=1357935 RepID=UPI0019167A13|nr:hypothetical protein [Pseudanabaena sp. lw0831]GBO53109.1 hypothetical protein APA_1017 [Pseudanabaena sp. lw0831]
MSSIFSLKSSIALLVLGTAMLAAPKQPVKSTLEAFSVYQPAIAASAVGAIADTMQYEIV